MARQGAGLAAEFRQQQGPPSVGAHFEAAEVDMLRLDIGIGILEPARGGVPYPARLHGLEVAVEVLGVVLAPALVEQGVQHDAGVVVQVPEGLLAVIRKKFRRRSLGSSWKGTSLPPMVGMAVSRR